MSEFTENPVEVTATPTIKKPFNFIGSRLNGSGFRVYDFNFSTFHFPTK
jgi:predicted nucleic acid-binding Zn ribbon protein